MNVRNGPVVVIVMSHKDPPMVHRLVGRLREGRDVFVAVHHDPTGEPLRLPESSDLAMVPDPTPCPWGRLNQALAMRRSLRWAAERVPEHSWILLVSGQDYPARSMRSIEDELRASKHDAFLRHFRLDDPSSDESSWQALARRRYLRKRRLPFSRRSFLCPRPMHPYRNGVHLYGGGVWFNLSREAVQHVVSNDTLAEKLIKYLRWSPNPDETLVHSLLLNGEHGLSVVNDNRRFIRWERRSPHPRVLAATDLPAVAASDAFFARKVDRAAHPDLLDALDELAAERRPRSD